MTLQCMLNNDHCVESWNEQYNTTLQLTTSLKSLVKNAANCEILRKLKPTNISHVSMHVNSNNQSKINPLHSMIHLVSCSWHTLHTLHTLAGIAQAQPPTPNLISSVY